jgi:hypothetical protein
VTEAAAARTLALPFFNRISDAQIDEVCSTLGEVIDRRTPRRGGPGVREANRGHSSS